MTNEKQVIPEEEVGLEMLRLRFESWREGTLLQGPSRPQTGVWLSGCRPWGHMPRAEQPTWSALEAVWEQWACDGASIRTCWVSEGLRQQWSPTLQWQTVSPLSVQQWEPDHHSGSVVTCHNAVGPHCNTGTKRLIKALPSVHYSEKREECFTPLPWNL